MKLSHYLLMVLISLTLPLSAHESAQENTVATINTEKATETGAPKPRIIALAPHIVEMLFDVGAGDQIIAATRHADYPEAAKAIPRIGSSSRIQIERIIELQPDLIIAWKNSNPSDDLARIKQLGFNIVYSQPYTFDDVAKEIRLFGELSGHREQGERVATKFLADLAGIKSRHQKKQPLSGFYEVWSRPITTIAKDSWPQQFLDICSITNPFYQAKARYPQVNIEQILQANVDIIIQPLSENQKAKEGYEWQKWPIIPAVKHQQIIQLDADVVHRMTTRSLGALTDLCQQAEKSRKYYRNK
jgi:vitamin B12 transport system substrate-binding protein